MKEGKNKMKEGKNRSRMEIRRKRGGEGIEGGGRKEEEKTCPCMRTRDPFLTGTAFQASIGNTLTESTTQIIENNTEFDTV